MNLFDGVTGGADGGMPNLLDHIQNHGVPAEQGRAFATWLEGLVEGMERELSTAKEEFRDYCDAHPAQVKIIPEASTFYLKTKGEAQARAHDLAQDPRVLTTAIQFEPDNGWVVVILPSQNDLSDLVGMASIQDGRVWAGPEGKVRKGGVGTAPVKAKQGEAAGSDRAAPSRGATARVWAIADTMPKADRATIIAACVAEGINPSTAGTQYSKWKKSQ